MSTDKEMTRHEEKAPERIKERHVFAPLVDIYENEQEILLIADLPGVLSENLHISIDKDELSIDATRTRLSQGSLLSGWRDDWDYSRAFRVPNTIDTGKIEAQLKEGVLHLHLPKKAAVVPRKITVTGS